MTGSDYGITLLIKVEAFLPMVGLGAFNKLWLKPRVDRAISSSAPGGARSRDSGGR
jgi:putative copper export protein